MRHSSTGWLRALGLSLAIAAIVTIAPGAPREPAPAWVTAATHLPVTVSTENAPAVILRKEGALTVSENGLFLLRSRVVLRVLNDAGRRQAIARLPYVTDGVKVKNFSAWTVHTSGAVTAFGKQETVDAALYKNALELYGQHRLQIIDGTTATQVGEIFAYEYSLEEKSVINEQAWFFGYALPTQSSAFTVQAPVNWVIESRAFNVGAEAEETNPSPQQRTWSLSKIGALATESNFNPDPVDGPWVGLRLVPPPGRTTHRLNFRTWSDLSDYFTPVYLKAAERDSTLIAKAQELTAHAKTPWEKFLALAQFTQQVNYISIQLDAAKAGGVIPRPARSVLKCNYGDCKDKATLLLSLLATQDVAAYPLVVKSGPFRKIEEAWPSLMQFNHCILAVRVEDAPVSEAVIEHPHLGRLLLFDPTNEFTPPGYLAAHLLGRQGLLLAGPDGGLITLPVPIADAHTWQRKVRVRLAETGAVAGSLEEKLSGLSAASARRERATTTEASYRERLQRALSPRLPNLTLMRVSIQDLPAENSVQRELEVASRSYARVIRDQLIAFKPSLLPPPGVPTLLKNAPERAITLPPMRFQETSEFQLPAGWSVDELKPSLEVESAFGRFSSRCKVEGDILIEERRLELKATDLPASDYAKARSFFDQILRSDQTPVVLKRG